MFSNKDRKFLLELEGNESRKIFCTFNQQECTSNDFEIKQDEYGFVSYTFKGKYSYVAGRESGFKLALNLSGIKCNECERIDGIKVIVHNHSIDPGYYFGQSKGGINVANGLVNEIRVTRTFSSKLDKPYNNCLKDIESLSSFDSDLYRFILQNTSYIYRQQDCFDYCFGREMIKYFNSSSNLIIHYKNLYSWLYLRNVSLTEVNNVYKKLTNGGELKSKCLSLCPLECDSIKYDLSYSFTKPLVSIESLLNISLNDIIYINVYYESLDYTNINQVAKMDEWDLISNIGGNLGLFIGFSFLNLVELIELIIEIIIISVQKKSSSKRKVNS